LALDAVVMVRVVDTGCPPGSLTVNVNVTDESKPMPSVLNVPLSPPLSSNSTSAPPPVEKETDALRLLRESSESATLNVHVTLSFGHGLVGVADALVITGGSFCGGNEDDGGGGGGGGG
jgi:hypothetical protein